MYIYKITHTKSKRFYVGRTQQKLQTRYRQHIRKSSNKILKALFDKYSIDCFKFECIDTAKTVEELKLLEQTYLDKWFDNELCINHYKSSYGIDSQTASLIGKTRGEDWVKSIKEGAKVWRETNKAYFSSINQSNIEKGRDNFSEWLKVNKENNKSQLIKARQEFIKNETPEEKIIRLKRSKDFRTLPINLYKLEEGFIKTYNNIKELLKDNPSFTKRGVKKVLYKKSKSHKGYYFKYNK